VTTESQSRRIFLEAKGSGDIALPQTHQGRPGPTRNHAPPGQFRQDRSAPPKLGVRPPPRYIESTNLVNRKVDPESYENYLRARALIELRQRRTDDEFRNVTQAASLLESALAKNPEYAPAWALLAGSSFVLANDRSFVGDSATRRVVDELRKKVALYGASTQFRH
jgi:hypothetical protein